ncbi:MAG: ankyrin repeat domain-containing protein [Acidobacteria bacterium]|nr:ankyrin repeat domain-containing protein [Acidobacteriota bacterium]
MTRRLTAFRGALAVVVLAGLAAMAAPALGAPAVGARVDLPLIDAVRAGDVERARVLIADGVDVNGRDGDGTTALHWAALNDDVETAGVLVAAGAKVEAANRFDATPMALAAENGSAAFIELLLDAGADPDAATPDGETALMTVSRTGRADALRLLLGRGADPNRAEAWRGQTALMWASAENNLAAAEALLAGGADVHERSTGGFSPLMFAVRAGYLDMTRLLVDAGASPEETLFDGTSALVLAAKNGHYELGAYLLDAGADPNADDQGWTALHEVKWTRRPNLGFNNPPPIVTGSMTDLEFIRKLAEHGADLDARMTKEPQNRYRNVLNRIGSTPFLLAAKAADVDMMRVLVELGADPLLPNEDGTTPLMVAAGVGIWAVGESPGTNEEALDAVKYALELGGDVTRIDDNGDTALHGAIIRGSEPLVRFLLDQGADIEATNEKGWTPYRIAKGVFYSNTGKRWPEMETLLLELGADPSTATGADNTISDWTIDDPVVPDVR